MWFRKFLLSLAAILLGLTGVVFGGLFLLCLGLYLLWHSLVLGVAFFGLIGGVSLVLTRTVMCRISTREKSELPRGESSEFPEIDWSSLAERTQLTGSGAHRHKIR
jgi:membrane protein implicated in regulation of membrane protease activity